MYGGAFVQRYGWYINQTRLRMGIYGRRPEVMTYLPEVCPSEWQQRIDELKSARRAYLEEMRRLNVIVYGPDRADIPKDEPTYWHNVRTSEAGQMITLRRQAQCLLTSLSNKIEDLTRQEFGFRGVGDAWVNESILHQLVRTILPNQDVVRHYRPDWLGGLELDIYLPQLGVALEYQGQQHFHAVAAWGGKEALTEVRRRDAGKVRLCRERGVPLATVDYTEPLTEEHVREVLSRLQASR